jgi:flagellar biosynthesis protein FlhF
MKLASCLQREAEMQTDAVPQSSSQDAAPLIGRGGSTYRFVVRSAEEAVRVIRERLGPTARVISVRSVKAPGFSGMFGSARLEVVAQIPAAPEPSPAAMTHGAKPAAGNEAKAGEAGLDSSGKSDGGPEFARQSVTAGPGRADAAARRRRTHDGPGEPDLDELLGRTGLSAPLLARLRNEADWPEVRRRPLHEGICEVARKIRGLSLLPELPPLAGRVAFLGLPGAGRTTALCKWLSAEVFDSGRSGRAVTVEFDRARPDETLATYAELLGIDHARVPGPEGEAQFAACDLPPLSLTREAENARLRRWLDAESIAGRVLVLSSLGDPALLRRACGVGRDLGCTHLIFTHLDELPQWGRLWDFLVESPFVPLFGCTGPGLAGECETDVVGAVLRRTFPGA